MTRPLRAAVLSRSHVVRAGLLSLIGQLDLHVVVVDAEPQGEPDPDLCDVAIYDLAATRETTAQDRVALERLLAAEVPVIGLVYGDEPVGQPPPAGALSHVVDLSVVPDDLMKLLDEAARQRVELEGSAHPGLPWGLTEREFAILELIATGASNDTVARTLYLSINSVKSYIRTAYRKIGVSNRAAAVVWAVEHGVGGPRRQG